MKKLILLLLISQSGFAQISNFKSDIDGKQVVAIIDEVKKCSQASSLKVDSTSFSTGGKEINFILSGNKEVMITFTKVNANTFYFRRFQGHFDGLFQVWKNYFDPNAQREAIAQNGTWKLVDKSRAQFRKVSSGDWTIEVRN